jgi:uncharacterized Zn-finger protein
MLRSKRGRLSNGTVYSQSRYVYLGLRGKTMCFKCLPPSCSPMVLTEELSTNDEKYGESPSTASSISSEESEDSDDYEYTNCQRDFKCKYAGCRRSFDRKSHLNAHLMAHTGEKLHLKKQRDYKCSIVGCAKGFKIYSDLRAHLNTHDIERPFSCPHEDCDMRFATNNLRASHMRVHSIERKYKCESCDIRFRRSSNLHGHYKSKRHQKNAENTL